MSTQFFIILLLLIPFFVLMAKWSKAVNQYRDLYQKKLSPKIPVSDKALTGEFRNDPSGTLKDVASGKVMISWMKALFGKVEDQDLNAAQSKARRALAYTLIYMVVWFIAAGMIFYFSSR